MAPLGSAAVMLVLREFVHPASWAALGLCVAGGTVVYAALIARIGLDEKDRNGLLQFTRQTLDLRRYAKPSESPS